MKHQYFGDINDYRKYGLLRCLSASGLRIGVCWMLTPNDKTGHGGEIDYLNNPEEWRRFDPELFDQIHTALKSPRKRNLRYAENESFLPKAKFFGEIVPEDRAKRKLWFDKMKVALADTDIVFFDPDNGIEVKSTPYGRKGSSKYVYWRELEEIWESGQSLLIFQFFAREKRSEYIERLTNDLVEHVPNGNVCTIQTLNFFCLIAYKGKHAVKVEKALRRLKEEVGSTWIPASEKGVAKKSVS